MLSSYDEKAPLCMVHPSYLNVTFALAALQALVNGITTSMGQGEKLMREIESLRAQLADQASGWQLRLCSSLLSLPLPQHQFQLQGMVSTRIYLG